MRTPFDDFYYETIRQDITDVQTFVYKLNAMFKDCRPKRLIEQLADAELKTHLHTFSSADDLQKVIISLQEMLAVQRTLAYTLYDFNHPIWIEHEQKYATVFDLLVFVELRYEQQNERTDELVQALIQTDFGLI